MKKQVIAISLMMSIVLSFGGCASKTSETKKTVTATSSETKVVIDTKTASETAIKSITGNNTSIEKDVLQEIFVNINENFSSESLESLIAKNNLYYSVAEYNKNSPGQSLNYVIAYTEGSALQKYADIGDHLEISFDEGNGNKIMYAQYINSKNTGCSALFYNYGVWYDFRENSPGSYSGYYLIDSLADKTGITIKYSNGNETSTNYYKCNSADEAIQKVICNS